MKDENEECSQLPNECSICDGSIVRKPEETQPNELLVVSCMSQNIQPNEILTSLDPDKCASTGGNTEHGLGNAEDFSSGHQNVLLPLPKMVHGYHENSGMVTGNVEPNSQASVVSASYFSPPSTSLSKSENRGNVLGRYPCPICGGRYVYLSTHMRIHSPEKHVCSICKKEYRVAGYLKNHMMMHADERPYTCRDCNDRFETSTALKKHMVTHASENNALCTVSGKSFAQATNLKADTHIHERGSEANLLGQGPGGYKASSNGSGVSSGLSSCGNNTVDGVAETMRDALVGDNTRCNVCGRKFLLRKYLLNHMTIHTGEKRHKCSFCDMKFRLRYQRTLHELGHKGLLPQCNLCGGRYVSLSAHMMVHSTDNFKHVCSLCQKAFRRAGKLKLHMLIHSGEKPYTCADCGSQFRCSSNLKSHMKVHTKEKKHVCTVCGKMFAQSGQLKIHMQTHTGDKPYSCETCGNSFSQNSALARHRLAHTSVKPFICSTCGKQFRTDTALWRHKMIHSGDQPYECSVCGMKFNQSNSMKRHMLVHTGEKPYSCSDCGERFTQSGGLASHRRRHCPKIKNR